MITLINVVVQLPYVPNNCYINLFHVFSDITVTTEELAEMLKAITQVTDEEKVQKICTVMDEDRDGNISLDELTKVLEGLVAMVTCH